MAKLVDHAPGLLRQALERVARGDPGDPQDESQATEAGLFEDAWRIIDWSQPARTIHNQVRSWVGLRDIPPGALGEIDGETLQITKTRLVADGPRSKSQRHPARSCGGTASAWSCNAVTGRSRFSPGLPPDGVSIVPLLPAQLENRPELMSPARRSRRGS